MDNVKEATEKKEQREKAATARRERGHKTAARMDADRYAIDGKKAKVEGEDLDQLRAQTPIHEAGQVLVGQLDGKDRRFKVREVVGACVRLRDLRQGADLRSLFTSRYLSKLQPAEDGAAAEDKPRKARAAKGPKARTTSKGRLSVPAGTVLEKEYKGKAVKVTALEGGAFRYAGTEWPSLSAIVCKLTDNPKASARAFFGL